MDIYLEPSRATRDFGRGDDIIVLTIERFPQVK